MSRSEKVTQLLQQGLSKAEAEAFIQRLRRGLSWLPYEHRTFFSADLDSLSLTTSDSELWRIAERIRYGSWPQPRKLSVTLETTSGRSANPVVYTVQPLGSKSFNPVDDHPAWDMPESGSSDEDKDGADPSPHHNAGHCKEMEHRLAEKSSRRTNIVQPADELGLGATTLLRPTAMFLEDLASGQEERVMPVGLLECEDRAEFFEWERGPTLQLLKQLKTGKYWVAFDYPREEDDMMDLCGDEWDLARARPEDRKQLLPTTDQEFSIGMLDVYPEKDEVVLEIKGQSGFRMAYAVRLGNDIVSRQA